MTTDYNRDRRGGSARLDEGSASIDPPERDDDAPVRPEEMPDPATAHTGDDDPATEPTGGAGRWGVTAITLVSIAALFLALDGLKQTASILMPAFLALNLAIVAQPLNDRLQKKGMNRALASTITLFVLYLVLAALVGMMVWAVWIAAEELPQYTGKFTELYNSSLDQLARYGVNEDQVRNSFKGIDPQTVMDGVTTFAGQLSGLGSQLLILVVAMSFMAFDIPGIVRRSVEIRRFRPHFADAIDDFNVGIRNYWIVSTVFGFVVAVIDTVALLFLGVPLALVWGVFAFVTNYIPNVGFVIGLIPPALFALLTGGPMTALWVIVAYCVINFVMQSIIQPKLTGDAVGISATVTFLSLVFWSAIAGGMGAILAVPLTLAAKAVFVDPDPQMTWLSTFLTTADAKKKQEKRRREKSRGRRELGDPAQT